MKTIRRGHLAPAGAGAPSTDGDQSLLKSLEKKAAELYAEMERDPFYARFLYGRLTRDEYAYFLVQSYHYVRLAPDFYSWALETMRRHPRPHYAEFIGEFERHRREEIGHEKWILEDLAALGFDAQALVLRLTQNPAVNAYIALSRCVTTGKTPLAFLGEDFFLESLPLVYGERIGRGLSRSHIPGIRSALKFITSHGAADVRHMEMNRAAISRLRDVDEKRETLRAAETSGWFYAAIPRYYAGL